ncbi:hypothetical protein AMS68_000987 [Peltaster fructicola]|uniref:Malate dehydrogenase n=1 Tax=Peltaster fructicola TaxID=286661 RepID=A0A6H0XLU1_9PEZI|nr:hypothetical protein AMS68_000987 [Peltaster fructicola]
MHTTQIINLLMASLCLVSAAPAPAAEIPRTSPMDKRTPEGSWWQKSEWHTSFIDFTRRRADPQSVVGKCDMQSAKMPTAAGLPPPSAGLYLSHVAVGRGTQNYTCANSSATPAAIGALATLYNVSCVAADTPVLLDRLPVVALNLPTPSSSDSAANVDMSGHHYFIDLTTAYFNLKTDAHDYGGGAFKKVNSTAAPSDAAAGQEGSGDGAVAWLKLIAKDPKTQSMQEVYRVNTAGGNPPKTCEGQDKSFEVQYSAEYWIWSK